MKQNCPLSKASDWLMDKECFNRSQNEANTDYKLPIPESITREAHLITVGKAKYRDDHLIRDLRPEYPRYSSDMAAG